jgi:hypothetical protein
MAHQHTTPDKPSHTPGIHRGEEWSQEQKSPGWQGDTRTVRDATGINAYKRRPIDPKMPNLPPA